MDKSDVPTVSKHGLKFMHTLDKMISLVGSGDDEELVAAIHGVRITIKIIFFPKFYGKVGVILVTFLSHLKKLRSIPRF